MMTNLLSPQLSGEGQQPHHQHQGEVEEGVLTSKDDWQGIGNPGEDPGNSKMIGNGCYNDSSLHGAETLSDKEPLLPQEGFVDKDKEAVELPSSIAIQDVNSLLSSRDELLTATEIFHACQESNGIVEDNPFVDGQRTTGVVSNGSDEKDHALASLRTSPAMVMTNVLELGEEMSAQRPTPSVDDSGNQTLISGKNNSKPSNHLLCLATPGRPENDQEHPPEMTPPPWSCR